MTINPQSFSLPFQISRRVETMLDTWQVDDRVGRLWRGDASLWTGADESRWLGWLRIVDDQLSRVDRFGELTAQVRDEGLTHAVLLGMGGSSLCPEVLASTFDPVAGMPELIVLDSTDPSQIRSVEARLALETTLFLVSSKSGTTLESSILLQYFLERMRQHNPSSEPGRHFIAITDPGSGLDQLAGERGFRAVFHGKPEIGGRFSALSDFGMVPAAVLGLDVRRFLRETAAMVQASSAEVPAPRNPAVGLGIALGVAAEAGRDKTTLVASPGIQGLGAWLEQLLAESTGKGGKGLIPVDGEELGVPESYGEDRVFVYLRLNGSADAGQDAAVAVLAEAGNPVIRIEIDDNYRLGQELFRWELATAVLGSHLGLNPFDQPDVEASKVETRKLTSEYESSGVLPEGRVLFENSGLRLFADDRNARALAQATPDPALAGYLKAHLDRIEPGDYCAVLAYIEMSDRTRKPLDRIRRAVGRARRVATSVGFGPRFLHSTGQVYKGGPNSGVFVQITCDDNADIDVPGHAYTFGTVKAAQAQGDLSVLAQRGRRFLRVHISGDLGEGLETLAAAVDDALAG